MSTDTTIHPLSSNPRTVAFVAVLFLAPLLLYVSLARYWSLGLDEWSTYDDSIRSVEQILQYEKPLYYLIAHLAIRLPIPVEYSLRLPAAIAAGLIACTSYLWLIRLGQPRVAWLCALFLAANPWIFELSQFGRHYGVMLWLVTVTNLSLYGWMLERRVVWLVVAAVAAILATTSHTTAIILFPASILAIVAAECWTDPTSLRRLGQRIVGTRVGQMILAIAFLAILLAAISLRAVFHRWSHAQVGQFGDYGVPQLLAALLIHVGPQIWLLGLLPLFRAPRSWSPTDVYLVCMIAGGIVPYLLLTKVGGGIDPKYLLATIPSLFILAARHCQQLWSHVPTFGLRIAMVAAFLTPHIPALASTWKEGNHYDYRQAARFLEGLNLNDPIVAATGHRNLDFYFRQAPVIELGSFAGQVGPPGASSKSHTHELLPKLIASATASGRPLILVSRQDRHPLDGSFERWINERFAQMITIERPRFDQRRNRLVIYEYRPRAAPQ